VSQSISNAFNRFCETSYTNAILKNERLINFRNGQRNSGLLERSCRSLVVEPVLLVVSLCVIVETVARIIFSIVALIAYCFSSDEGDIDDTLCGKLALSTGRSLQALGLSTSWITKNLLVKELDYDEDLEKVNQFFRATALILISPLYLLVEAVECTGLSEFLRPICFCSE
jgi:hypothetical protein